MSREAAELELDGGTVIGDEELEKLEEEAEAEED